jgi:hypothetical protein
MGSVDRTGVGVADGSRRWWQLPPAGTFAGERVAIWLMTGFLALWLLIMVSIQFGLVIHHHGLGVTKQDRVPPEIVKRVGVGDDRDAVVKATLKPRPTQ